jgi:hypothetical protein
MFTTWAASGRADRSEDAKRAEGSTGTGDG